MLPSNAAERKKIPVYSGFLVYFPHAVVEVARLSLRGNEQHNPGSPLRWDRSKSGDELDSLARHLLGMACSDNLVDEIEEATAVAWRAMANLEKLCEKRDKVVPPPRAWTPGVIVDFKEKVHNRSRLEQAEQRAIDAIRGIAGPL